MKRMHNMSREILSNNIFNEEKYQVFVLSSPCSIPINLFVHTWFVVNNKGTVSRYEVLLRRNQPSTIPGYVHIDHWYKNVFPTIRGMAMFYPGRKFVWTPKLLGFIESDENGLAHTIAKCIENSEESYPYKNLYHFWGPNSNTYTAWILKKFPEFKVQLPWTAVGKNYTVK